MDYETSNRLAVLGSDRDVECAIDAITTRGGSGEGRDIDFDKFDPMPEILKHVAIGCRTFDGVTVNQWWTEKPPSWACYDATARLLTDEEEAEIAASGSSVYWEWRLRHWGVADDPWGFVPLSRKVYLFKTISSPPEALVRKLSAAHPTVVFLLSFAHDEPEMYAGLFFFFGGRLYGSHEFRGEEARTAHDAIVGGPSPSSGLEIDLMLLDRAFGELGLH